MRAQCRMHTRLITRHRERAPRDKSLQNKCINQLISLIPLSYISVCIYISSPYIRFVTPLLPYYLPSIALSLTFNIDNEAVHWHIDKTRANYKPVPFP